MKAIGIDIGTTGISGILLNAENGSVIKSISKNSNSFIKTQNSWEKIQDVNKIITTAKEILNELIEDGVKVIGVTGQMHGIVYFDENGIALSPLYIWQDGRGDLEYKGTTYAKHLNSFTGYGCVTDFYNRENGLVPKNSKGFCTIADYFVMNICGLSKPVIHTTNIQSFGCYDIENKKFNYDYKPNITDNFTICGYYKNIPVSVAIGDNQASVLSCAKETDLLINVGTGSQVSVISNSITFSKSLETRPYFEGKYLTVGSALCGGRAYSLMKDFIKDIISYKAEVSEEETYKIMGEMLEVIDNPSVKADTRFAGTRYDSSIKGSFTNITTENFKIEQLVYSVLFGMNEELFDMYVKMNSPKTSVVGSGNGIRKNAHLIDIIERTYKSKLKIPKHVEEASFGSAIFGLIAINKFSSVSKAQEIINYVNQ